MHGPFRHQPPGLAAQTFPKIRVVWAIVHVGDQNAFVGTLLNEMAVNFVNSFVGVLALAMPP